MTPLRGLKVLELARILAGPWAGQTLSDLGADVIKVESPEGDGTRGWGPPFLEEADGTRTAAYFHGTNRGKRSVVANLRDPADLETVKRLADDADVVIENYKVGGLVKFGLDYPSLKARNPGLVYCSITGFGQDGPYAKRAGYDVMIQAMSGLMSITGAEDGPPMKTGVAIVDIFSGLYATIAIQAALAARGVTGQGQQIDISLLDVAVAVTANQGMNYLTTGLAPGRLGNGHPNIVPYQAFEVADGWIILAVGSDGQFAALCDALGASEIAAADDYATNRNRVANRDVLITRLSDLIVTWSRDDLLAQCEARGIPAGPINDLGDVFADPHVRARGVRVEDDGIAGIRSPLRFSESETATPRRAPPHGGSVRDISWRTDV